MAYKLGSLFDGSGGFPQAGALCGVEPCWASEVEPYPIAVTRSRFPRMKHLGDISKINGGEIEPVDIITFGSPCQDLSVAGKRAGIKHEANGDEETTRSGLFMEAVRIIKEMRAATDGLFPRFALWENVPGAFSSQKGEDFRVVLEELIRIVEPRAVMPEVPRAGWAYADSYTGDGWSLAYRVFDAQYWGVPQRRRRIHLVVDFRGQSAREVLFKREGVRGYFETGRTPRQTTAADAQDRTGANDRTGESGGELLIPVESGYPDGLLRGLDAVGFQRQLSGVEVQDEVSPTILAAAGMSGNNQPCVAYTLKIRSGCEGGGKGALVQEDKSATLATNNDQYLSQPMSVRDENWADSTVINALRAGESKSSHVVVMATQQGGAEIRTDDKAPTITAAAGMSGNNQPVVCYDARGNGDGFTVSTLTGDHESRITDYSSVVVEPEPVYCLQGNGIDRADTAGCNGKGWKEGTSYTLNTIDRPAGAYLASGKDASGKDATGTLMANAGDKLWLGSQEAFSGDYHIVEETPPPVRYIVRRLTPTECARLQGFADQWGHVEQKTALTEEEYHFWLEVRNTHKVVKDYTAAQMLTWYNKLWTDSAEYKMWGNGIALPPALYCMQGIVDALETAEADDWMT